MSLQLNFLNTNEFEVQVQLYADIFVRYCCYVYSLAVLCIFHARSDRSCLCVSCCIKLAAA